jgi:hypothetical protein
MLEKLTRFNYLGTADYFHDLLNLLQTTEIRWTEGELRRYFINSAYKYPYIDGGIALLKSIGILATDNEYVVIDPDKSNITTDFPNLMSTIANKLLETLNSTDEIADVFKPTSLSYNSEEKKLHLSPQSFPLKLRGVRSLLLDLEVIDKSESTDFTINKPYDKYIEKLVPNGRRSTSLERLKANLARQEELGMIAEEYVIRFEKRRVAGHRDIKKIVQTSLIDVSAGYDIVSFNSLRSKSPDRYIEVKSYNNTIGFYWTQNEIETARTKGDSYFLYLVDRSQIHNPNYIPLIIEDPYRHILLDDGWNKTSTILFVTRLD